jgi:hypothetical protein
MSSLIPNTEKVARILAKDWIVNGEILHIAFTLREKETYISVNRPSVESYDSDVKNFVETHPDFYADDSKTKYSRALLNVGDIRATKVSFSGITLNINVEVEPRDVFTKSHAGIFTRHGNQNIKTGDTLYIKSLDTELSADEVLLEVRSRLIDFAKLEYCGL